MQHLHVMVGLVVVACGSKDAERRAPRPEPGAPGDAIATTSAAARPGFDERKLSDADPTHELVMDRSKDQLSVDRSGIEDMRGDRYARFIRDPKQCFVRVIAFADPAHVFYARDHGCDVDDIRLSPDGKQLAIASGGVKVIDVATGKLVREDTTKARGVAWSNGGLVILRDNLEIVFDGAVVGRSHGDFAVAGDFVVDETVLEQNAVPPCPPADCFPAPRIGYHVIDLKTKARKPLPLPAQILSGRVEIAANGTVTIHTLYHLFDSSGRPPLAIGFTGVNGPTALSDDGRLYAFVDGDYSVRVYDIVAGALVGKDYVGKPPTFLRFEGDKLLGFVGGPVSWTLTPKP